MDIRAIFIYVNKLIFVWRDLLQWVVLCFFFRRNYHFLVSTMLETCIRQFEAEKYKIFNLKSPTKIFNKYEARKKFWNSWDIWKLSGKYNKKWRF